MFLCLAWAVSCSRNEAQQPCSDPLGCVTIAPGKPVRLGVIQSLSGKVAVIGQDQLRGFELALEKRGNKLLGREVSLLVEDTGCKPEGGAVSALKIVSDPAVLAIFGTTCSADAATAAQVMTEAGLSMISGNNSAPFLTSIGGQKAPKWQPGFFRTAPNEEFAGPAAARFAFEKLGLRLAAVINDGDIYTRGLTEGFRTEFERLGGKVALSATVNKGDANMAPVLEAVAVTGAQLVFFPLFQPEGNHVLAQARKTPGLENLVLMSDGALIDQSFLDAVSSAAVGMYFVGPTPPPQGPEVAALTAQYVQKFKQDPPTDYWLSAYDAAGILFAAIEKAAQKGPGGSVRIGRQALRDALYATRDHKGVGGLLACNEFGDCARPSFNVLRLEDSSQGVKGLKANVVFTHAP
ncbi:branched-chain amino acid ABC transporter substrate-binding protein [Fundidesulfovibrio magnetotacticus]|nr:branched-chain amino acid ABC transporter substrate-binding protein [Fundidesulfovibrio magnetotacticus]